MVSDVFAGLSQVGSLAEHALVANHSHSEVVHSHPVVLPAHNLRGHVARRPRGVLGVVGVPHPGYPQVGDPQVAFIIKDQVLRLYVSVQDALPMQVLKTKKDTSNKKLYNNQLCGVITGLFFGELTVLCKVITKVSSRHHV